jgi:hypothetical protein
LIELKKIMSLPWISNQAQFFIFSSYRHPLGHCFTGFWHWGIADLLTGVEIGSLWTVAQNGFSVQAEEENVAVGRMFLELWQSRQILFGTFLIAVDVVGQITLANSGVELQVSLTFLDDGFAEEAENILRTRRVN